jgi:ATP-dependent RNA helicase DOB1
MWSKLNLLREFQLVSGEDLTHKGRFAKAVYGYELLLSDLYAEGVFEGLDEVGLGVIAVSILFEPRKNQKKLENISKIAGEIKAVCDRSHERIRKKEIQYLIRPLSKAPHFNLSKAIEAWIRGATFSQVLRLTETDEGEVIRYFRMAVQILREIKDAPISPELSTRISNTLRLINRDVVDAEKQLREE